MVPMELRQMRMNLPAVHMLLPLGPMRIGALPGGAVGGAGGGGEG